MSSRKYLFILIGLLLLVSCSRPAKPPITTWIDVPVYPKADMISHERGTSETWMFTTTAPMTDVLEWYDQTYTKPWYDIRGSPTSQLSFRVYENIFNNCSRFYVYIEYHLETNNYSQDLSRRDNRDCK